MQEKENREIQIKAKGTRKSTGPRTQWKTDGKENNRNKRKVREERKSEKKIKKLRKDLNKI